MPDDKWLEVSLVVDGEYAESVAEVLSRFAPNGVSLESTAIAPDLEGEGSPVGPLRVRAFLPVDERLEETRRRLEESLWYLSRIRPEQPLPTPQYTLLQEVNWLEAWKQYYRPLNIGRKLIVAPAWLEMDALDRVLIRIDPGMAFGTGSHPTTQLCLELLEMYLAEEVIDLGCGSGILSIAALKLGARRALGVDIDPQAIPIARENAAANGVAGQLELGVGSLEEIQGGKFSIRKAPLVLVNILAPALAKMLEEGLADLLSEDGVLVLSGILEEQWDKPVEEGEMRPPLLSVIRSNNLRVLDKRQVGDWIAAAVTHARR